jgi:hypothetical protein
MAKQSGHIFFRDYPTTEVRQTPKCGKRQGAVEPDCPAYFAAIVGLFDEFCKNFALACCNSA